MRGKELILAGLRKSYGDVPAVSGVDLTVEAGSLLTLLGPSGCGKTTILRMIAGFVEPTAGSMRLGERELAGVPANRRRIGVVFQNYALFPHMTVAGNTAFGLMTRKLGRAEIKRRVADALDLVHLRGFETRFPAELSGGQQQRAALARALVIEPDLLLLDEPLSALDKSLRQSVQQELRRLQQEIGVTTVVVTHDQEEAFALSDQVAVMSAGRIVQVGSPQDIYDYPANRFVADFLGAGNFLSGTVTEAHGATARISVAGLNCIELPSRTPLVAGSTIELFCRPERVWLNGAGSGSHDALVAEARVVALRSVGSRVEVDVRFGENAQLVAHVQRRNSSYGFAIGETVHVKIDQGDIVCLPQ